MELVARLVPVTQKVRSETNVISTLDFADVKMVLEEESVTSAKSFSGEIQPLPSVILATVMQKVQQISSVTVQVEVVSVDLVSVVTSVMSVLEDTLELLLTVPHVENVSRIGTRSFQNLKVSVALWTRLVLGT